VRARGSIHDPFCHEKPGGKHHCAVIVDVFNDFVMWVSKRDKMKNETMSQAFLRVTQDDRLEKAS
jgi:hypothetical protein